MVAAPAPAVWEEWMKDAIAEWRDRWLPTLEAFPRENEIAVKCAAVLRQLTKVPPRETTATPAHEAAYDRPLLPLPARHERGEGLPTSQERLAPGTVKPTQATTADLVPSVHEGVGRKTASSPQPSSPGEEREKTPAFDRVEGAKRVGEPEISARGPTPDPSQEGSSVWRAESAAALEKICAACRNCPHRQKTAWRKPLTEFWDGAEFLLSLARAGGENDGAVPTPPGGTLALPRGDPAEDPLPEDWSWVRGQMTTLFELA